MNAPHEAPSKGTDAGVSNAEWSRIKAFITIQILFLFVSPLAGGFHYKMWSMLDTALLLASIGITGLIPVLETRKWRSVILKVAMVIYVLAIIDMSVNVLVSGSVGWGRLIAD